MSAELKLDITEIVRCLARQWRYYKTDRLVDTDGITDGLFIGAAHDIMQFDHNGTPTFVYVVGPMLYAQLSMANEHLSQLGDHDVWATALPTQEEVYQMVDLLVAKRSEEGVLEAIEKLMARHRTRNGA